MTAADRRPDDEAPVAPEFGPRGYLPDRAARRARKIILRAPMGLQWVVGSLVVGVVVVVGGLVLLGGDSTPAPPFQPVGSVAGLPAVSAVTVGGTEVLVVSAGGRVRAFADAPPLRYCPASNRLESPDGGVWALTGRGLAGAASLSEHPATVVDGVVYVDPTSRAPGPDPDPTPASPTCT